MDIIYNYLPGHGDLRLQRHSKIAEISVHYHNTKGGDRGDARSRLVINLSVISIHATYSQWAAAQSAKIAHGAEGSCIYNPLSIY
jgi:hypothetical protein